MDLKTQLRDWGLLLALLLASTLTMLTQNQSLVRALRAQTLEVTAQIESSFAWAGRYLRVLEENSELRRQNIELSSQVARTRSIRRENHELKRLLNLQDSSSAQFVAARIVAKDIYQQENFLTLDVGASDGVEEGMPVVHEGGIIGTVMLTSQDYARVMPYLNTDFRVPATILPLGAEGIVRWDGERLNRLLLDHVVKTEPVEVGQRVVTSGHSDVFPPGRAIGTVDSVASPPGRSELTVYLQPAVPLHEINYAFVLIRQPSRERLDLENQPIG